MYVRKADFEFGTKTTGTPPVYHLPENMSDRSLLSEGVCFDVTKTSGYYDLTKCSKCELPCRFGLEAIRRFGAKKIRKGSLK